MICVCEPVTVAVMSAFAGFLNSIVEPFSVDTFIASLKLASTEPVTLTLTAALTGDTEVTTGGVTSGATLVLNTTSTQ